MQKKIDNRKFGKVAVLMGGEHSEREISLMTGGAVLEAFLQQGIDAHGVDVGPNICDQLIDENYDRAFIALHGTQGEDGTIQALLEVLNIPYTGSNVVASAIAMNKDKTKLIWQALGLPILPFMIIDTHADFDIVVERLGLPLVIKPTCEGSSVGVSKVSERDDFQKALDKAALPNSKIMAEPWIEGDEYSVSILNDRALPVIRISTPEGFYDYDAKYFSESTGYHIPSGLAKSDEKSLQQIALEGYKALECSVWGRVDVLRDPAGKFWLNTKSFASSETCMPIRPSPIHRVLPLTCRPTPGIKTTANKTNAVMSNSGAAL